MIALMYGVTLLKDWDTTASQLIYDLILFILLAGLGFNAYSIDNLVSANPDQPQSNPDNFNLFKLLFSSKKVSRRSRLKTQNPL
ncbi:MAG: hypothetical protein SFT94_07880 [Pseudanabaenaceae cyanobacterium bins.68]|nr:hypothetical protein [Pseudanabaenaceae cyanobacterium bins.68]